MASTAQHLLRLLVVLCCQQGILTQSSYRAIYKTFNDLTSDYNRAVRPQFFGKETNVGVELYLIGVPNVDTKSMQLDLDMYFRQYWKDDRLKFSAEHTTPRKRGKSSNVGEIKHASLKDKVWTPDPFFANQKEGKVLTNPADNTLFKILSTGDITYSSRQLVTTYCPMDFHAYPFDTQKCTLEIESFAHTVDEIRFFWKGGNSSVELGSVNVPNFKILGHRLSETFVELKTGKYNRLHVTFYLQRSLEKFIHSSVVPSTIIVMTSAAAFWLHPLEDCGSRVLTLTISVFALVAIYVQSTNILVIGYLTYADYFFFCCLAFLAVNISIFLLVLIVRRNDKRREKNGRSQNSCLNRLTWLDGIARLLFVPVFAAYIILFVNQSPIVVPSANVEEIQSIIPYIQKN